MPHCDLTCPPTSCSTKPRTKYQPLVGLSPHHSQLFDLDLGERRVEEDLLLPHVEHVLYAGTDVVRHLDKQSRIDFRWYV